MTMHEKHNFLAIMCATLAAAAPSHAAKPVIDAAAIAQSVQNFEELSKQYEELTRQYEEQVRAYKAANGSRSLGRILWDPRLREILPADFSRAMDAIARLGIPALSPEGREVLKAYGLADGCRGLAAGSKSSCEKKAAAAAETRAYFERAGKAAAERSSRIEGLLDQIDRATDQKSIADLTARINAETAGLEAERIRVAALERVASENERLTRLQEEEATRKRFAVPSDWRKYLE
ncbi:MAG: type IV secretion system protein [Sutterellaceae bacterium]|nr:type IV secretion system protein [Sutterellaceae bacterium]MDD7441688.1 type IV secretion system protein [Sutterellaceae bacterium]MDY2868707.1 type IV secretion system protein [Mesosutterella sp.]